MNSGAIKVVGQSDHIVGCPLVLALIIYPCLWIVFNPARFCLERVTPDATALKKHNVILGSLSLTWMFWPFVSRNKKPLRITKIIHKISYAARNNIVYTKEVIRCALARVQFDSRISSQISTVQKTESSTFWRNKKFKTTSVTLQSESCNMLRTILNNIWN